MYIHPNHPKKCDESIVARAREDAKAEMAKIAMEHESFEIKPSDMSSCTNCDRDITVSGKFAYDDCWGDGKGYNLCNDCGQCCEDCDKLKLKSELDIVDDLTLCIECR